MKQERTLTLSSYKELEQGDVLCGKKIVRHDSHSRSDFVGTDDGWNVPSWAINNLLKHNPVTRTVEVPDWHQWIGQECEGLWVTSKAALLHGKLKESRVTPGTPTIDGYYLDPDSIRPVRQEFREGQWFVQNENRWTRGANSHLPYVQCANCKGTGEEPTVGEQLK